MRPLTVTSVNAALEWDAAATPIPGEQALGDCEVVAFAGARVLVAAVDGLGHGPEAAAAARAAVSVLQRSAGQDPAAAVLECHRALRDTRGAALSLASIDVDEQTLTWVGVGNVEARLLRGAGAFAATESLLLHSGIVGHSLPRLSAQTTKIARGDVLLFATDGIARDFADDLVPSGSCREIAHSILDRHGLGSDDALVLVARYLARG
jgi:serine phosphatase RsbU (regulator of sigma subunit)